MSMIVKGLGLALLVMGMASVGMANEPIGVVPEIDGGMLASGMTLISGAALIVSDRLRRRVK
jgi:hypothetical protein